MQPIRMGIRLTYHLVGDEGVNDNALFDLNSTSGVLTNSVILDYETNDTTYTITVQAKDEHNVSLEHNFTVYLSDVYEPSQPNHFVDLNSTVSLEMIWVTALLPWAGEVGREADETQHEVTRLRDFTYRGTKLRRLSTRR